MRSILSIRLAATVASLACLASGAGAVQVDEPADAWPHEKPGQYVCAIAVEGHDDGKPPTLRSSKPGEFSLTVLPYLHPSPQEQGPKAIYRVWAMIFTDPRANKPLKSIPIDQFEVKPGDIFKTARSYDFKLPKGTYWVRLSLQQLVPGDQEPVAPPSFEELVASEIAIGSAYVEVP